MNADFSAEADRLIERTRRMGPIQRLQFLGQMLEFAHPEGAEMDAWLSCVKSYIAKTTEAGCAMLIAPKLLPLYPENLPPPIGTAANLSRWAFQIPSKVAGSIDTVLHQLLVEAMEDGLEGGLQAPIIGEG